MSIQFILLPLFVQVALTIALGFRLAGLRVAALGRGEVKPHDIALRQPKWPQRVLQYGNAYANQFEVPVLFYVLTVLALHTRQADLLFVALSWVFVLSRVAHACVHVTSNDLRQRGLLFGIGAVVVAIMWVIFALRLAFAL